MLNGVSQFLTSIIFFSVKFQFLIYYVLTYPSYHTGQSIKFYPGINLSIFGRNLHLLRPPAWIRQPSQILKILSIYRLTASSTQKLVAAYYKFLNNSTKIICYNN